MQGPFFLDTFLVSYDYFRILNSKVCVKEVYVAYILEEICWIYLYFNLSLKYILISDICYIQSLKYILSRKIDTV